MDTHRLTPLFLGVSYYLHPVAITVLKPESAALFLKLGLLSTLIRHENGAF